MFYAHFVLAKKGPLARIWLAAHWDKKLTKAHVFETNIESSVEGILQPKVKMALRTSGHLLLGIVRIYSRKAKYLLADCNEAFIKIKIAFRPGVVDLPEGNREASVASITLPEVFHDFDTALPDITIDMDAQVSLNQSRAEDITLKEDYGNLSLMNDDGFDDNMGFDEVEDGRGGAFDDNGLFFGEEPSGQETRDEDTAGVSTASIISKPKSSYVSQLKDDGFGGTVGEGLLDGETGGLFEPAGLFDDAPLGEELDAAPAEQPPVDSHQIQEKPLEQQAAEEDSDDDMYDAPCSMGAPSPPSSPESPVQQLNEATHQDIPPHPTDLIEGARPQTPLPLHSSDPPSDPHMPPIPPQEEMAPPPPVPPMAALDHTTLINNDAESFALAPLDAMIAHGSERTVKAKRKRKLVVDEVKSISGEEMKSQLSDTTDIVATLDLAPPTKRLMHWKETGGVEKLFSLPGHRILSKTLTRSYLRHLTTRSVENEDEQEEIELQPSNYQEKDQPPPPYPEKDSLQQEEEEDIEQHRLTGHSLENAHKRARLDLESSHVDPYSRTSYDHSSLATEHSTMSSVNELSLVQTLDMSYGSSANMMTHYPDLQQLSHLPQGMGAMNQGPSLQSITPSIQSEGLPPDPIAQHLGHIQQQQLQQQLPVEHHLHPMPPPTADFISPADYMLEQHPRPPMNGQNMIDDDATQPLMEQYPQAPIVQQHQLPSEEVPSAAIAEAQIPNSPEQPITTEQNAFDQLFDHIQPQTSNLQQEPQTSSTLNNAELEINRPNEFMGSDDEDNYEAPASVGPAMPEEQQADETYEQFEERILTKRTTHLLHVVHDALDNDRNVSFANLVRNNKRKQVAQKFYTFLVLKKQQAVELEHNSSGDLIITKGPKYDQVYNGN